MWNWFHTAGRWQIFFSGAQLANIYFRHLPCYMLKCGFPVVPNIWFLKIQKYGFNTKSVLFQLAWHWTFEQGIYFVGFNFNHHGFVVFNIALHKIHSDCQQGTHCEHCMTLHDTTWHCMTLPGTEWHCMTLNDIAWHCMTLHDTACLAWYLQDTHGEHFMTLHDIYFVGLILTAAVKQISWNGNYTVIKLEICR